MLTTADYFPELEEFRFKDIFNDKDFFWHALNDIDTYIEGFFAEKNDNHTLINKFFQQEEKYYVCTRHFVAQEDIIIKHLKIFIGAGTIVEPTALIGSNTLLGNKVNIRHGAYIRGNVLAGDHSTLGHTTEVKNSIVMNHSEAGHFAYIGDSILGSYVNLGAGTKFANLPFRTLAQKKDKKPLSPIILRYNGKCIDRSMRKLGIVAGDSVELGCNSVTCPGTFFGPESMVYPCTVVKKDFYPAKTRIDKSNL